MRSKDNLRNPDPDVMTTAISPLLVLELVLAAPVCIGSVYYLAAVIQAIFWIQRGRRSSADSFVPGVSVLKPLFGADKNLHENLRSMCRQVYPRFEVILAIQRPDDPSIPVARAIAEEFGPERVRLCISNAPPRQNGKVENLVPAIAMARHEVVVISDSDVRVAQDYLKTIVSPLSQPSVGAVCMLYRAAAARGLVEWMEHLSINADFLPELILAKRLRLTTACLGCSTALRRETLDAIGGLASLAPYLAEDAQMGARIAALGLETVFLPSFVETMVDLKSWKEWWQHQVYWDQNARYVHFKGFLALPLLKAVPFALLFAAVRGFDELGLSLFGLTAIIRIVTAGVFLRFGARDYAGLRALGLLPLRDIASLPQWLNALLVGHFTRRGETFAVTSDGKIVQPFQAAISRIRPSASPASLRSATNSSPEK